MYGKDDKFIIDENTRIKVKNENEGKRLIGLKGTQLDAFDEEIEIQVIMRLPVMSEIEEFQSQMVEFDKKVRETGKISFKVHQNWFKKLIVYPSLGSEEEKSLEEFLQHYPTLLLQFSVSTFGYASRAGKKSDGKPVIDQDGNLIQAPELLEAFKL